MDINNLNKELVIINTLRNDDLINDFEWIKALRRILDKYYLENK